MQYLGKVPPAWNSSATTSHAYSISWLRSSAETWSPMAVLIWSRILSYSKDDPGTVMPVLACSLEERPAPIDLDERGLRIRVFDPIRVSELEGEIESESEAREDGGAG